MQQEDKACFVQGGKELAKAAYKTGFDDGFEAAVYSLMTISDGLKERDGAGFPPEIIVALGKCRAKAFECFGRISSRCEQCPRWAKSSSCSLD